MAQIALSWDSKQLRLVVASGARSASRLQFDKAVSFPWPDDQSDDAADQSAATVGEQLRAVLEKAGVQKGDATVVVARNEVEMRQFDLPPVPSEELPDMVRFQARNQFNSFNDDFLVDFIPLESNQDHSTVLAAALSDDLSARIHAIIEAAGLRLRHIVLRPFASVRLAQKARPDLACAIVMELIGRQADITVVDEGKILMTRTVRVADSSSAAEFDEWIPGEIQRTISSARGQSGAGQVNEVIICGNQQEHRRLSELLSEQFSIPVSFLSPFEAVQTSSRFETPEHPDGFASLTGSLVHNAGSAPAIDFLNPRKRPEIKVDRKQLYQALAVATLVLLAGSFWLWSIFRSKDAEIAELNEQIKNIKMVADKSEIVIKDATPLDKWLGQRFDPLEELQQISLLLPDQKRTRLENFRSQFFREGNRITLSGLANKDMESRELIDQLRKRRYNVVPKSNVETDIGGFASRYSVELNCPFANVLPNGTVQHFYQQPARQQATEVDSGNESTKTTNASEVKLASLNDQTIDRHSTDSQIAGEEKGN